MPSANSLCVFARKYICKCAPTANRGRIGIKIEQRPACPRTGQKKKRIVADFSQYLYWQTGAPSGIFLRQGKPVSFKLPQTALPSASSSASQSKPVSKVSSKLSASQAVRGCKGCAWSRHTYCAVTSSATIEFSDTIAPKSVENYIVKGAIYKYSLSIRPN